MYWNWELGAKPSHWIALGWDSPLPNATPVPGLPLAPPCLGPGCPMSPQFPETPQRYSSSSSSSFFFFFCFLEPHLQHMEAPRLGVKSEHGIWAMSVTYTTAKGNCQILNPLREARGRIWVLVRFVSTTPQGELPVFYQYIPLLLKVAWVYICYLQPTDHHHHSSCDWGSVVIPITLWISGPLPRTAGLTEPSRSTSDPCLSSDN